MLRKSSKIIVFLICISPGLQAQGLKNKWGLGLGGGIQQLYSDYAVTPVGAGVNGLLTFRLSRKLSVSLHSGFSQLPYQKAAAAPKLITNILYSDLVLDYEFRSGLGFRPFLKMGFGGVNFKSPDLPQRYNTVEGIGGWGTRYFLNPGFAFMMSADVRVTESDDLDGSRAKSPFPDAYFSGRFGFTKYLNAEETTLENDSYLTQKLNVEQLDEDDSFFVVDDQGDNTEASMASDEGDAAEGYNDFLAKLSALDDGNSSQLSEKSTLDIKNVTMEEYLRLKSKIDKLNSDIDARESTINDLAINAQRSESIPQTLDTQADNKQLSKPVNISNFSAAYENALSHYYRRRYSETIRIMQELVDNYHEHSLASNCEYWIAQCLFDTGEYSRAISTLEHVIQHPRSLKKDDALLLIGRAYIELDLKQKAQQAFNRLIQEFPDSEYVVKSEQYLRKL